MPDSARCVVCKHERPAPYAQVPGKRLCRCGRCGLIFAHPRPAPAEATAFYEAGYYDPYLAAREANEASYTATLDEIEKRTPVGSLLDVGCGVGHFLAAAVRRGWRAQGVEPSPWPASHARENSGLSVRTATLEDAAFREASFDVVTLWSTVEHLPDPPAVLREGFRVLRPGGAMWVAVPNTRSLGVLLHGLAESNLAKPEHLFHFNVSNLRRLLVGQVGLEGVERVYLWGDRRGRVRSAFQHLARRTRLGTEIRLVGIKPRSPCPPASPAERP
ncbi:MAG: class I SAM-dependent methyltransferase [Myxococcota bacterium]